MADYDNEKRNLEHWSHRISQALQILDLEEENELILKPGRGILQVGEPLCRTDQRVLRRIRRGSGGHQRPH
ncbi:hypothetical protein GCM10009628_42820 [Paeniglutamicibacter kerguelensis]|uniref:Uncharacterized protein n=1 Tax=Paeniglutamicibacter kerguelensis TaxID=254788 RepID=A0ABS4XD58_9MICC|nr:hypothetical protein [Paeniglutamicibacter kerguelensis]